MIFMYDNYEVGIISRDLHNNIIGFYKTVNCSYNVSIVSLIKQPFAAHKLIFFISVKFVKFY